jgi:hypothetical protein
MSKLALTGGLTAAFAGLTAVMLVPRPASAAIAVAVQAPTVSVSVNGPNGPAPGPGYVWQPETYVMENGAWVRRPGYWRPSTPVAVAPPVEVYDPGPQQEMEVDVAPPPPIVEVQPAPPVYGAVWIPGYWQWARNHHVWVGGRWSAPRPGHLWVTQRWYRHGQRWAYAPGYWQPAGRPAYYRGWDRGGHDHNDRYDHDDHHDHHGRRDNGHHRHGR